MAAFILLSASFFTIPSQIMLIIELAIMASSGYYIYCFISAAKHNENAKDYKKNFWFWFFVFMLFLVNPIPLGKLLGIYITRVTALLILVFILENVQIKKTLKWLIIAITVLSLTLTVFAGLKTLKREECIRGCYKERKKCESKYSEDRCAKRYEWCQRYSCPK